MEFFKYSVLFILLLNPQWLPPDNIIYYQSLETTAGFSLQCAPPGHVPFPLQLEKNSLHAIFPLNGS